MKLLWCWRRKAEMPMLDQAEEKSVFVNDSPIADLR